MIKEALDSLLERLDRLGLTEDDGVLVLVTLAILLLTPV